MTDREKLDLLRAEPGRNPADPYTEEQESFLFADWETRPQEEKNLFYDVFAEDPKSIESTLLHSCGREEAQMAVDMLLRVRDAQNANTGLSQASRIFREIDFPGLIERLAWRSGRAEP